MRCARWSSGPRTHSNPKTVIEVTICLPLTINLCQCLSMKSCRDHSGKLRKGMNSSCRYVMTALKFSFIHVRHVLTAPPWTFLGREFRVREKSTHIRECDRQFGEHELPACGLAMRTIEKGHFGSLKKFSLKVVKGANHSYSGREKGLARAILEFVKGVH